MIDGAVLSPWSQACLPPFDSLDFSISDGGEFDQVSRLGSIDESNDVTITMGTKTIYNPLDKRPNKLLCATKAVKSIMKPFGTKATVLAALVAILLSWRAQRKKSLTPSGSLAAFAVGFLSIWTGARGWNLLIFYQLGTMATKYKKDIKIKMDGSIATSGSQARGPAQVLACSLVAVLLGLIHGVYCGEEGPIEFGTSNLASCLTCGILAHHATCLADTLASELGILSKSPPVLVTRPWKTVPSGTNGGVTPIGFFWSTLGGLIIGISTIVLDYLAGISPLNAMPLLVFTSTCGLLGSLIDSLLGATIQQTYYDQDTKLVYQKDDDKPSSANLVGGINMLTNEQVNVVSVALTTAIGGWVLGPMFFI